MKPDNVVSIEKYFKIESTMDTENEIREISVDNIKYRICCCPQCELNGYFNRVNNRNNRLKRLIELKAPECILQNEAQMLREGVDALLDYLHNKRGIAISRRKYNPKTKRTKTTDRKSSIARKSSVTGE